MPSSPEEMAASMIANMPEKTGKSLPQWLELTLKQSFEKHGELVKWLKTEHGVTHGFANLIAHETRAQREGKTDSESDLVDAQYAGAKSDLKPIYDKLQKALTKLGKDVEVAPKKSYVSFRRNKQFALVKASTKTRVDVGINLKEHETTERLVLSGSFNQMVSHKVSLTSPKEVDKELISWLKEAYEES
ncbi:DUF4287 domain-containing protein [Pleionea sp. CnH1-48]|uniref:DUF4287 domain-containing protein n=1 Tax=Pleionea sp. CnH1-48 TaxID=2954494 RepID=UPI00209689F0|nr:DUF4287 domain-containing protein [Pleionea sp. CnH1-48]MCO7222930.1 DUF4287 domain-containing protein [Pleionea sp. CnH1-48]